LNVKREAVGSERRGEDRGISEFAKEKQGRGAWEQRNERESKDYLRIEICLSFGMILGFYCTCVCTEHCGRFFPLIVRVPVMPNNIQKSCGNRGWPMPVRTLTTIPGAFIHAYSLFPLINLPPFSSPFLPALCATHPHGTSQSSY
jgi:hypothetical protein